PTQAQVEKKFWIACLFTSQSYGKNVSPPASILDATGRAIADLEQQIKEYRDKQADVELSMEKLKARIEGLKEEGEDGVDEAKLRELENELAEKEKEKGEEMGEVVSVRINSGLFGVEWAETKKVLEGGRVDMVVVRPKENKEDKEVEKKGIKRKGMRDEGTKDDGIAGKKGVKRKVIEDGGKMEKKQMRLRF
ncbi:MAG: hypothetical protein Q9222_007776, partial [Ikaeria aurantiellina]